MLHKQISTQFNGNCNVKVKVKEEEEEEKDENIQCPPSTAENLLCWPEKSGTPGMARSREQS